MSYEESLAAEMSHLSDEFLTLARAGDLSAEAEFAPWCTDYRNRQPGGAIPSRPRNLADVMAESLDFTNGPQMADVLALLVKVAYSSQDCRPLALALIGKMAGTYAFHNADVSEEPELPYHQATYGEFDAQARRVA